MTCSHERFRHEVKLSWIAISGRAGGGKTLKQLFAIVRIICSLCGKNFIFKGENGISTTNPVVYPVVSPDCYELRAPLDFPDDDEDIDETIH